MNTWIHYIEYSPEYCQPHPNEVMIDMTPFKKIICMRLKPVFHAIKKPSYYLDTFNYGFTLFSSYDLYQACCCLHLWNIPKFRNGQGSSLTRTAHQMFQLSVPQWLKHRSTTCTARRVARSIPNRQEIPPDSPRMPWKPCTQQGGDINFFIVEIPKKNVETWRIQQCLHVCLCIYKPWPLVKENENIL